MANPEDMFCSVKGEFDIGVCSINRPNLVYPVKPTNLRVAGDPLRPVFTNTHSEREAAGLRLFLNHPDVHEAARQLILPESDSLHVFADCLTLYFKPKSVNELRVALDCLVGLARLFPPMSAPWDLKALPSSLRALRAIIQKWAIGDDSERTELLEGSSLSDLEELVAAVDAHLVEISRYRDSIGDEDLSEAGLALGTLEECAAEARLMLKRS